MLQTGDNAKWNLTTNHLDSLTVSENIGEQISIFNSAVKILPAAKEVVLIKIYLKAE